MVPNNSFKPTPHRGVNSVLCATLHAVATPSRGGLTQALGRMRNPRKLLRWVLLLAGIAWGALQLNGAVFAAWVAGGPPAPNPEGWLFVAGNRLAWAAASFLAGASLFVLLRRVRPTSRYAVVALVAAVLLTAYPYIREFIASDACLDSGGQWLDLRCVSSAPAAA